MCSSSYVTSFSYAGILFFFLIDSLANTANTTKVIAKLYLVKLFDTKSARKSTIINTKRYTKTRLQRILLYAILGITKRDMDISMSTIPYVRVLGFSDKGQEPISEISKKNRKLEVVSSVKKFMDKKSNDNLKLMMHKDIWATDVYTLGFEYDSKANLDYTHKLII